MKKILGLMMLIGSLALIGSRAAADSTGDAPADNTELILQKIRTDKRVLVADNMNLTESEAKAFWPIYDQHQTGLAEINKHIVSLVTDYGQALTENTITDEKAKSYINQSLSIDQSEIDLRRSTAVKLGKVLPATKVARYMQIESKIRTVMKAELMKGIPLIP
jgi:hypothetical protein